MENFTRAALLNTSATQQMRSGNSSVAFGQFREAIRLLSQCQCTDTYMQEDDAVATSHYSKSGQIPLTRVTSMLPNAALSSKESNGLFLCDVYEFTPEDGEEVTVELLALYSATLIYNCALCLHQKGGALALHKASNLYMQCLELLEPMPSVMNCSALLASVLQNQANIYYNMSDFHSARHTMDKLFLLTQRDRIIADVPWKDANTIAPEA